MTRDSAIRMVAKLREVREDRGATPAEARVAQAKANQLAARFNLNRREAHPPKPPPRPRRERRVWHAPPADGIKFNVVTGQAGDGVTVHRHRGPADWKIEIDLSQGWPT